MKEMEKYKTDIVWLQEVRWDGEGRVNKQILSLWYVGEGKQGQRGTF